MGPITLGASFHSGDDRFFRALRLRYLVTPQTLSAGV
jgi:hypothetical protein